MRKARTAHAFAAMPGCGIPHRCIYGLWANPPMPQVPPSLQPGTPLVTPLFLVSPFQFLDTLLAVHFHSSHPFIPLAFLSILHARFRTSISWSVACLEGRYMDSVR